MEGQEGIARPRVSEDLGIGIPYYLDIRYFLEPYNSYHYKFSVILLFVHREMEIHGETKYNIDVERGLAWPKGSAAFKRGRSPRSTKVHTSLGLRKWIGGGGGQQVHHKSQVEGRSPTTPKLGFEPPSGSFQPVYYE